ncbi:hypothetical protein ACXR2U_16235, partial [Jatrophihabitans sp. YIM 134969]
MNALSRPRLLTTLLLGAGVTGAAIAAFSLASAPAASGAPTCSITWTGATSTDWDTASNWGSAGRVPTSTDVACMSATAARKAVVSSAGATVRAVYFQVAGSSLTVSSGTFTVTDPGGPDGTQLTALTVSGGSLTGAWSVTTLTWTGGTLAAGTLTSTGTSSACDVDLSTGATWTNSGSLTWNSSCGGWGQYGGSRFVNASGATFSVTGTGANGMTDFGGGANGLVNAGSTTVTLGAAGQTLADSVPFANTGTVTVVRGTVSMSGGGVAGTPDTGAWNRTLTGSTVTGTAAWTGGTRTATTTSGTGLRIDGGDNTVGTGTLTGLTLTGGTLTVADTKTLTVAGL